MSLLDPRPHPFDTDTSCWDRNVPGGELAQWQLARAWGIAEHLVKNNPFYAAWDLPAGRTAADFRSLRLTTKKDVCDDSAKHPPYGSRTTSNAISHFVETSGTSGKGQEVYALDANDELNVYRAEAIGFYWAGVRRSSRVFLTIPVNTGAGGLWYYGGLRLLGANVMCVGSYPTARKVEVLRRYGADVVFATPSYAQRLATACKEAGLNPAALGVKSLVVAGEGYTAEWAAAIQEQWGATLYEQYGCSQRAIAWTCPGGILQNGHLGTLHFVAELAYCEVIDPTTKQPARHGQSGEIIVTTLQANASPLLRFATQDRIELVEAGRCACGRPLHGFRGGSVRRYDDMIKIRGANVWTAAFDATIFALAGVLDYRGQVARRADGVETVELIIECAPENARQLADLLVARVREELGLGVSVEAVAPGELTRGMPEAFAKMRRWRDLRLGESDVPGNQPKPAN